jgi:prepilin signal peptidase PulO-like enzyme (type II secretory pathway)
MLILRKVTLPATVVAVAANLALGVPLVSLAIGMLIGWGFFMAQILLSKGKWVGGGDAWLGLLMGAILGWPMVVVALFLAYISGALVGSVLLLLRRARMQSQLPFGTFLSAATIVALLVGDRILNWYLTLLS